MFVIDSLTWWYTAGWSYLLQKNLEQMQSIAQMFSIVELLKTLFAPFRQTLTGKVQGTLGDKLRALGDRIFSRCIGFVVRSTLIFTGLIVLGVRLVIFLLSFVFWLLLPLGSIIAVVLTAMQWVVRI